MKQTTAVEKPARMVNGKASQEHHHMCRPMCPSHGAKKLTSSTLESFKGFFRSLKVFFNKNQKLQSQKHIFSPGSGAPWLATPCLLLIYSTPTAAQNECSDSSALPCEKPSYVLTFLTSLLVHQGYINRMTAGQIGRQVPIRSHETLKSTEVIRSTAKLQPFLAL